MLLTAVIAGDDHVLERYVPRSRLSRVPVTRPPPTMAAPMLTLKPIEPKSPRWQPTSDTNDIVIPGLNTAAPPGDQIEQIEQLITIKLQVSFPASALCEGFAQQHPTQNIDANFSKIQQIMANRVLPAVKRYAVSTEPVREAAKVCNAYSRDFDSMTQSLFCRIKFWTTFFEQAAQIRVPTYDDYAPPADSSVVPENESEAQQQTSSTEEADATSSRSHAFNPDGTTSDISFRPTQAATMSTPAGGARHASGFSDDPTPSWSTSLESPLIRLDREVQSLTREDAVEVSQVSSSLADLSLDPDNSADITQRVPLPPNIHSTASSEIGKGREAHPLRQNVLLRNATAADTSATPRGHSTATSPLKVKGRTPNLRAMNPYFPANSKPADWKGVVDLKDPTVSTPRKTDLSSRLSKPPAALGSTTPGFSEDDSFNFGMSPPLTTDVARLPKLGKTPKKEAAERIMKSLVDIEKRGVFSAPKPSGESSMSSVPTPPSLSRYIHPAPDSSSSSVADASLESLMRRVGDGFSANYGVQNASSRPSITSSTASSSSSLPSRNYQGVAPAHSLPIAPLPDQTPDQPVFSVFRLRDPELEPPPDSEADLSSDSSFGDEMNNTANPSAAFLLAAQRASYEDEDDSFDSNQSIDSMDGDEVGHSAMHPLAHVIGNEIGDEDGFDDDSFDDPAYQQEGEEETLFGVPPAQRLQAQAQAQHNLRMLGEDLLQDTMGIGAQMAAAGRVEESPTPWGGRAG